VVKAKDVEPLPIMAWAEGRSYEQRMEITNRSEQRFEHCGTPSKHLLFTIQTVSVNDQNAS